MDIQAVEIAGNELDEIWSRIRQRELISEWEFLTVARWSYHAMTPERIRSAAFMLFEYAHSVPRAVIQ
jgi:hypothetical protein